ncbi:spore coat associated protein [Bacillus subtilis]|nr:spore coat associated protein [Bacillus subtilis]
MITLGFMSLSRQHEADYSAELAKRAPEFGIRFIRFTPFDISPDTLRVKASVYHSPAAHGTKLKWRFQIIFMIAVLRQGFTFPKSKTNR